jgi:cell wall-associated NlpC family hydrolase
VVTRASADQIADLKAQAAAIQSRIAALGLQESALDERYNGAVLKAQGLEAMVTQAAQQLAQAQARTNQARDALKQEAVQAYINGGSSPLSAGSNVVKSANDSLLRAEYVNTMATGQSDTIDAYRVASLQEQAAENSLKAQTQAVQAEVAQVAADRRAAQNSANQLTAQETQITGQVATLIAQQQAAAAAAARRAAELLAAQRAAAQQAAAQQAAAQQAAAQQAAIRQAATLASQQPAPRVPPVAPRPGNPPSPPPPVGSGAAGAVAAAESRVGDWYQWGTAGPSTFDCSGLVMWAYAQVGISLPHFSGGQYADTTHIPMTALQPGDLVFPADPSQHVAMYVGGGMIVEAPYTGAQVHIIPLSSFFVLASRVV